MQGFPQQDQTNCESEVCEIQSNAVSDHPKNEKHKKVCNGIRHNITDNQEQKLGLQTCIWSNMKLNKSTLYVLSYVEIPLFSFI